MHLPSIVLSLPLALGSGQESSPPEILGLQSPTRIFLGEGPTNAELHPAATGTLRAILLFARFPDGEEDRTPAELRELLVPGAQDFFRRSSYGRLELQVDAHERWIDMSGPSTNPGYDCSKHKSHGAYVAEVVAGADEQVDFGSYAIIYVAANRAPGVPNSPTFNAHGRGGFRADGHEIRHAVTFGNDVRQKNWGHQTFVHETGHVLGLPDLYAYRPAGKAYRFVHPFTGSWSPMGFQCHARHNLAWHKHKLGWLDADAFEIVREGEREVRLEPLDRAEGKRGLVLPISATEAFVAEVRRLSVEHDELGVLIYRVSTMLPSGQGPIRVQPCRPDDDAKFPALASRYVSLYRALYSPGSTFDDPASGVRITVGEPENGAFPLRVSRAAD